MAEKSWRSTVNEQIPSDDDLLHGRLDGSLTPEHSARLDARLAEDGALRDRASQLDAADRALDFLRFTDPAPALVRRVMADIHSPIESVSGRRATNAARQEAGMAQAAHARKVIWGVAAAAVVILGVFFTKGIPDVGGPAGGTVGVAKRYAAPQIADEDVKLDASAQTIQAFLDSEAFGRVMNDPQAIALLGDAKVRAAIGARAASHGQSPSPVDNAAINAVIDDPSFVVLVTSPAFEPSWTDAARKVADMNTAVAKSQLGQNAAGVNSGLNHAATGVNSGLNSAVSSGLGQGASGLNSGLKGGLNQGASGVNSGVTSGVTSGLGQGATGLNNGLKGGLNQGATGVNSGVNSGVTSGLGQGASGLNSGLKGGLNQGATGVNSGVNSGLASQLGSQLKGGLQAALQSALQSGLNRGLNSGLGQKSSQ